jgi:GNAT superfamily N-acetyltransferase
MFFDLTQELIDQIIFAMENQSTEYVVDSHTGVLVSADKIDDDAEVQRRYYEPPVWDSVNGFQLMERFAAVVRNPEAKESLRQVLSLGRKVFRNYKDVLKEYPEVESNWFSFKDREMKQHILEWYNILREAWGLEALGGEPEDSANLVYGDFTVRECNGTTDVQAISLLKGEFLVELEALYPGEQGIAMSELWCAVSEYGSEVNPLTLVAENAMGEFAGFVSAVHCPSYAVYTVVLNAFIVKRMYRGLGVGKVLLEKYLALLRAQNIRWVFIVNPFIPETVIPFLLRCGFERLGSSFVLDLIEKREDSNGVF